MSKTDNSRLKKQHLYLRNAISTIEFDGNKNIPTKVAYNGSKPNIGIDAEALDVPEHYIQQNFKLTLGDQKTRQLRDNISPISNKDSRSKFGITLDFFDEILKKCHETLQRRNVALPKHLMIAEPISDGMKATVDDVWLKNYRENVRGAIYNIDQKCEVEFLSEPFAVYQYYRYISRHSDLLNEKRKYVALVLDFGGGTFCPSSYKLEHVAA